MTRLSTIRHADRILVLRDGRVDEEGHHDDLLTRGGTYADLWHLQAGDLQETPHPLAPSPGGWEGMGEGRGEGPSAGSSVTLSLVPRSFS